MHQYSTFHSLLRDSTPPSHQALEGPFRLIVHNKCVQLPVVAHLYMLCSLMQGQSFTRRVLIVPLPSIVCVLYLQLYFITPSDRVDPKAAPKYAPKQTAGLERDGATCALAGDCHAGPYPSLQFTSSQVDKRMLVLLCAGSPVTVDSNLLTAQALSMGPWVKFVHARG